MSARLSLEDIASDRGAAPHAGSGVASPVRRLLTAQEVADILRVPRSTVYELARGRRIPHLKVGRRTLFEPQALARWIDSVTVAPRR